uniref:Acyl carrier protein n=1 Tax=Globodera rostochiensis TaxID=31243 RepID=A0A914HDV7_GLORO
MCSKPSALFTNRLVNCNRFVSRSQTQFHPVSGKKPPTLDEFDPLNPGEWQLGAFGKILPRLPEGTRCGKLVTEVMTPTFSRMRAFVMSSVVVVPLPQFAPSTTKVTCEQRRSHQHPIYTKKTVQERIMLVLNLFDKIDNDKLNLDSDFFKDLALDSLDFVELVMAIEDEFKFEIPDGDSDKMRSPRDIYQYICDKCDVYD